MACNYFSGINSFAQRVRLFVKINENAADPSPNDIVITANPIDFSTIKGISKFRSCDGHEFGYTSAFEGKEAKCSLKHYFVFYNKYFGTFKTVPIYSPLNGLVIHIENNDQVLIEQKPYKGWVLDITHIIMQENIKEGSELKAGQLVGYADTQRVHAFDIALSANKKEGYKHYDWYNSYDSIFSHMNQDIMAKFAAKGATRANMIILKSYRDDKPCNCDPNSPTTSKYCNFTQTSFEQDGNGVLLH